MPSPSTITLARQLFRAGRWEEAARVARHVARQDPSLAAECAALVGMSFLRAGRPEDARAPLEYALRENPSSHTLQLACAQAALSTGDDIALERALEGATVGIEKQRAALRWARRELPTNSAFIALSSDARPTVEQWESGVRALIALGRLDDAARLCELVPPSAPPDLEQIFEARVATARGDTPTAVDAWRRVLVHGTSLAAEAFDAMLAVDAPDEARTIAQRSASLSGDTLLMGRMALYEGRLEDARALLARATESPERRTTLAALALLSGDHERVTALLAETDRAPADELIWAESLRRRGNVEEAMQAYAALSADTLALSAAAPLCRVSCMTGWDDVEGEPGALVADLRADFPDLAAIEEPRAFAQAALDALSGNWGAAATRPRPDGTLRRQRVARPMRDRVAVLRQALTLLPLPEVLNQCAALEAERGPHPLIATYGAELLLWWGDYEGAEAWLARAFDLDRGTRWGHVGLATLQNLKGDPQAALDTMARQANTMVPLPNSAACTAESHLLLGDPRSAEADFRVALEGHPTRLSSWLGLALAQVRQAADPSASLSRVRRLTPVFHRQWQREVASLPVEQALLHGLSMLRGNRGSGLITWWTADGVFHGEQVARVGAS
ncbi:MAG: tetratricopeptide repeat protein [Polyangiales bacterium]